MLKNFVKLAWRNLPSAQRNLTDQYFWPCRGHGLCRVGLDLGKRRIQLRKVHKNVRELFRVYNTSRGPDATDRFFK